MARSFASASSQWLYIDSGAVTADPVTIAAWFYPLQTNAACALVHVVNASLQGGYYLGLNASAKALVYKAVNNASSSGTATSVNSYSANTWQHAVGVFGSTTSRSVVLNGDTANKGTNSNSVIDPTTSRSIIGVYKTSTVTNSYMNGRIAVAAIWAAELTDAEIARLYNNGIGTDPRSVRPDALVAYWPLLDNDGDQDYWGNFHLTASGVPIYAQHPPVLMRSRPKYVVLGSAAPTIDTIDIAGTRQVGNTLTCNATSSPGGATFAYQWYMADDIDGLNGTPISGATSQTYELSYANIGAAQKLYEGLDANGEAFIACGATPTLAAIEGS